MQEREERRSRAGVRLVLVQLERLVRRFPAPPAMRKRKRKRVCRVPTGAELAQRSACPTPSRLPSLSRNHAARSPLHRPTLAIAQRADGRRPWPRRPARRRVATPVNGRMRRPQRAARRPGADHRRQLLDGLTDHRSVLPSAPSVSSICSKSAETFPWISIMRRAVVQLGLSAPGAPLELDDPRVTRIRLAPSPRTIERLQGAGLTRAAPLDQMRRVQALAAQQRTDLPRARARVSLTHDRQLVLRAEPAPPRRSTSSGPGGDPDPARAPRPDSPSGSRGGCPAPAPTEPCLRCSHTALRDGGLRTPPPAGWRPRSIPAPGPWLDGRRGRLSPVAGRRSNLLWEWVRRQRRAHSSPRAG